MRIVVEDPFKICSSRLGDLASWLPHQAQAPKKDDVPNLAHTRLCLISKYSNLLYTVLFPLTYPLSLYRLDGSPSVTLR